MRVQVLEGRYGRGEWNISDSEFITALTRVGALEDKSV